LDVLTQKTEQKLEDLLWDAIQDSEEICDDTQANEALQSLWTRMCEANQLDPNSVQVHLVNNDEINAFAMPGGTVMISHGLVRRLANESELAGVLAHEIAIEEDASRRVRLRGRLADLLGNALGRLDEAVAVLRAAHGEAPPELEADVLAMLADALERADDLPALALTLERWAERSDAGARITILARLAEVYLRVGPAARHDTVHALERALAADPTHTPTLRSLARLYDADGRWAELVRMHLGEADATPEPTRRAAAHARIAEIHERHLGSVGEAIAHHRRALSASPTHAPSFHALERLYRRGAMHRELLALYRLVLDSAPDDAHRVGIWLSIAHIHEDLLDEPARAIDAYEAVLSLDASHRVAIVALQRVGERAARTG
jgi:tetratricopeptide (TPR) repeat protein